MTNTIIKLTDSGIQQVNAAIDHYNTLVLFMQRSLKDGLDYGKIQGCGDKPILFKPGAEKIATLFGLRESLTRLTAVQDFTGKDYGEPFFFYEYKCTLTDRSGVTVAECVGSCNSWEEKYRYRTAQRACPECGAAAIKRSGYEDKQGDKGWYCHSKIGGCNAKFHSADARITSQQQGQVLNERVFDQVNTIDKMAQKRAFVGAVILAANASNFFAIEHTEIQTIDVDADWEPQQDIANAAHLERVPVGGEEARDQGQLNRDRIQVIVQRTGQTMAQVKQTAGKTADQLNAEEMQDLINQLLIDWGYSRYHVPVELGRSLIDEIRAEQPRITDNNLILRFTQRCSEALSEQVPVWPRSTTVDGFSID